jgi:peptidoglycan/xylan/chitin deacetylase (PgdA/CDA1 family)
MYYLYIVTSDTGDILDCKGMGTVWALSYDDGPSANYTAPLQDFLDKNKLPATFFVVGTQVTQYPELVKRLYNAGHIIGYIYHLGY